MENKKDNEIKTVLFIVGTTGVGKSKLSLDLAERLNGEIVNADSMQIYDGNDGIMTAKPTPDEKSRVTHHLYDVVEMTQNDFNVNKYQEMAVKVIEDIHSRGKLPIIVGGTNYYIESLVFIKKTSGQYQFNETEEFDREMDNAIETHKDFADIINDFKINIPIDNKAALEDKYESMRLHKLLTIVDPKMGEFLHSNDKRRIINALFKYFKYIHIGHEKQSLKESDIQMNTTGVKLRYLPIFIWMCASPSILEARIWKRICEMIDHSMGLKEIFEVFERYKEKNIALDFEKGILQAIGYKEFYTFYNYITKKDKENYKRVMECTNIADLEEDEKLELESSKERLKLKTIQYTVYQIKWLTKRIYSLFGNHNEDISKDFILKIHLDDPKLYEQIALESSLKFIKDKMHYFDSLTLEGKLLIINEYCNEFVEQKQNKLMKWTKINCEKCNQELNGEKQWEEHIKTRKHKNKLRGDKKELMKNKKVKEKNEEKKENAEEEDTGINFDQLIIDDDETI